MPMHGNSTNMREMILATDTDGRKKALAKLLPYQRSDFIGIFKAMHGLPVTIRLLDPPLHEFLPQWHVRRNRQELAHSPAGAFRRAGSHPRFAVARSQPDARPSR